MRENPELLICMDMQQEQRTPRQKFLQGNFEEVMQRCREVLSYWRERDWPVIHLKRVAQAAWFNPASTLTEWLAGWSPKPGENAFEHSLPSAYSSPRFAEFMNNLPQTSCLLIGFSLEEAILATAIESMHRGHSMTLVADAIFCRQIENDDSQLYRATLLEVLSRFAVIKVGRPLYSPRPLP